MLQVLIVYFSFSQKNIKTHVTIVTQILFTVSICYRIFYNKLKYKKLYNFYLP